MIIDVEDQTVCYESLKLIKELSFFFLFILHRTIKATTSNATTPHIDPTMIPTGEELSATHFPP